MTPTSTERLDWSLQDYSIDHLIASGHFGTVYHARHIPSGRDVALKLIPLHGPDSDEKVAAERHGAVLQQRFGQTHARLVPEVFEHQSIAPFYAISMELVHGRPLTTLLSDGPVPSRQAAHIALAIARFLDTAHQFETAIEGQRYALIVHADLKPDHILLLANGEIRVLDFGIAKALAARTIVTTNKWGSVQYASPERLQSDGQVNEHADFWSLGVMLFEMLAGFRPYRKYEYNQSLLDNAIRRQEPREPLPPHIEAPLVAVVSKLLAPQIERRYQNAADIVRDLEAFLGGAPTTAGLEHAQASQETVRLQPPQAEPGRLTLHRSASQNVPTEPLRPQPASVPAPSPASVAAARAGTLVVSERSKRLARLFRVGLIIAMIAFIAGESVSLIRAQRFRAQIPLLDVADIANARMAYERLGSWTPIGLGRARVSKPLRVRMTQLADRIIVEFRNERPAIAKAQWEQALAALDLALRTAPGDAGIASRRAYVRGHLARISKRYFESVQLFHAAANLDRKSFDPYLGLASVYAYGTPDLGGLTDAVAEAERRGYRQGRRERAEFGDLYRTLGDGHRVEAARASGPAKTEMLQRAAGDYARCIEYFDGLQLFNSEANLRTCRRRLTEVQSQMTGGV